MFVNRFCRVPPSFNARFIGASGFRLLLCLLGFGLLIEPSMAQSVPLTSNQPDREGQHVSIDDEIRLVRRVEKARIRVINQVIGSVVAIYGNDRQGGGSGVIIDPSGIALTNHHVIEGAGTSGWGGLADGKLYPWKLVGTDPGGDIAIIQLSDQPEFPWARLGNSNHVKVGDWALAMGNPFLLAEDQVPTVTLGIVSGIERYQSGSANQLVYGNCIQIDSSINPGNSGGPLFNLDGEVIGINGRGSFRDRGRVNVGLGYAISVNQIKNFLGELYATKLVEHGTLDASFSDREGKVVCSLIDLDSPIARAGLELGDELLEFEGVPIRYSNQFTNLICTLPENWPASLVFRKPDGELVSATVRLFGLPYSRPQAPPERPERPDPQPDDDDDQQPVPDQDRQNEMRKQMIALLSADPGIIRDEQLSQHYADLMINKLKYQLGIGPPSADYSVVLLEDSIFVGDHQVGDQRLWVSSENRFKIEWTLGSETTHYGFDGQQYWKRIGDNIEKMSDAAVKMSPIVGQATAITGIIQPQPFSQFGRVFMDGSDKADKQISCRLKALDDRDDWYYIWLSIYDHDGNDQVRLTKTSSELDGDRNGGAVVFRDWEVVGGMPVPKERLFVEGLNEEVRTILKTRKAREESVAGDWFDAPHGLEEKQR